jgi:hypothetical protein
MPWIRHWFPEVLIYEWAELECYVGLAGEWHDSAPAPLYIWRACLSVAREEKRRRRARGSLEDGRQKKSDMPPPEIDQKVNLKNLHTNKWHGENPTMTQVLQSSLSSPRDPSQRDPFAMSSTSPVATNDCWRKCQRQVCYYFYWTAWCHWAILSFLLPVAHNHAVTTFHRCRIDNPTMRVWCLMCHWVTV